MFTPTALTSYELLWYAAAMQARHFLAALFFAALPTPAFAQFAFFIGDPPPVVVYDEPYGPRSYDPYYNRPKVYREPVYYETKTVKKKGNKVTTKTQIKNQNGRVVYENKKTKTKKSKKKKK